MAALRAPRRWHSQRQLAAAAPVADRPRSARRFCGRLGDRTRWRLPPAYLHAAENAICARFAQFAALRQPQTPAELGRRLAQVVVV